MRVDSSEVEQSVEAGQAGGSTPSQPTLTEEDLEEWRFAWRIESNYHGRWVQLYDNAKHAYRDSSLEGCIQICSKFKIRKFREERNYRIRNIYTGEIIPVEALGL